ncbi:MAG: hypothetical protein HKM98_00485 [Gammaproteobacteria bacterium]|nr:hypothetical protein [Gammaproteobacteria bacterium]
MKYPSIVLVLILLALPFAAQSADDPKSIFKEVIQLLDDGDTEGALEEAKWGVERLEQLKQDKVSDIFPDKIDDFEGGDMKKNKAMGMMVTSRDYSDGKASVTVNLTESTSEGGALAGFGAIAQMAGVMGGGRKVRIQRRTGSAMSEGNSSNVNLALQSGGSLMFESRDLDLDALIAFAEAFPVEKIDEARN